MSKKKFFLIIFIGLIHPIMAQQAFFQGHRGCRGYLPENTIPAFEKALDLGVVLEMDVCISKDEQVVVSHEPYMNALFSSYPDGRAVKKEEEKSLNLYQMTYAQIRSFDVGKRGNTNFPKQVPIETYKPLLKEVLTLAEAYRKKTGKPVYYNIEIKSDSAEYGISQPLEVKKFTDLVYSQIISLVNPVFVTIQSFDFKVIKHLHQEMAKGNYQKCSISALVSRKSPQQVVKELGFTPDIYSSSFTSLSKETVNSAQQLGMKVIPWTVNDEASIQRLIAWGVDGIITDYPPSITPGAHSSLNPHP